MKTTQTNGSKLPAANKEEVKTALAVMDKNIADKILDRVAVLEQSGGLNFPANYSYANALKAAWLILQTAVNKDKKPVLATCTKGSIANSLLDMVIQGLSPAKKQCYFVPYGSALTMMRSYMGTIAVTKRVASVTDIIANVIYQGDTFKYKINPETGYKEIIAHDQELINIDPSKIIGAYALVLRENKPAYVEVMTIAQIRTAWNQGAANGASPAHKNFTDEMAKKTVISRACKLFFNSSNDSDVLIESINRTTENEIGSEAVYEESVQAQIEENANKEVLDIDVKEVKGTAEPVLDGPGF